MKKLIFLIAAIIPIQAVGQTVDTLTLEYCYSQIEENYPMVKKIEIEREISALNQRIAASGLYPEIKLKGSASYQSDVTEVPFTAPGASPMEFSKDRYNISLEVSQTIFDGGLSKNSKALEQSKSETEVAGIKAQLWSVRGQMEQVYFGILQLQKNLEITELLRDDIQEQLQLVRSRVKNGILLPGNALVLEAELLKVEQKILLIDSEIEASFEVLGLILGQEVHSNSKLQISSNLEYVQFQEMEIQRPELDYYEQQQKLLTDKLDLAGSSKLPKVSAFGTAAYGRPGLNLFDDDLQEYWIVGVRAQWSFRNWNNSGKKMEVMELQKRKLNADEESFLLNVNSELSKSKQKIQQLQDQIELDKKVVELRKKVVDEKEHQLQEGTITSTEYITELNAENRAMLQLELHQIQLNKTMIDYLTQKGISWK